MLAGAGFEPPAAPGPSKPENQACQVYVGNLPYSVKWQELKDHMKTIGNCENARILTVDGTEWGRSRGVGVVRFSTEAEAQLAIEKLNGSEMNGRVIVVDQWTGSSGKWQEERAERIQKLGEGGGSAQEAKPGDWICPMCNDLQFARNMSCRTCGGKGGKGGNVPNAKPGDWICPTCNDLQFARNMACRNCGTFGKGGFKGGKGGGKGMMAAMFMGKGFKGFKGFGGKFNEVHGDNLVYVGNLAYEIQWQDLKDHMKQAGTVEFCRVLTEDGTDWGRSKGAGCVRYSSEEEVERAISMLAESELKGRKILVDRWAGGKGKGKGGGGGGGGSGP